MSFTFRGTYTQNNGDAPAAGTVAIKNRSSGATLDTATLDAGGSYELVLDEQEGEMRVVETITGVPVRTYEVGVSKGSVTDTSRDIGYTGPAQSGATDLSAYETADGISLVVTADAGIVLDNSVEFGFINIVADDDGTEVKLSAAGADSAVLLQATGVGGKVQITAAKIGFGETEGAITRPELPASPTEQNIADALVALGLVTQAGA